MERYYLIGYRKSFGSNYKVLETTLANDLEEAKRKFMRHARQHIETHNLSITVPVAHYE